MISSIKPYAVTPFPEGVGSIGNAMYFVIVVGIGASLIYLLMRRKSLRLINLLIGFAITAAILMLAFIYLFTAMALLDLPYIEPTALALAVGITVLADVAIFRNHNKARNLTVLLLGGALGTFLGWSIFTLSAVLILSFLAVYDTFAVYRGPVGKIARSGLDQLRGLSFSFKDIQMGLGDLTFYSMLSGHMLLNFGYLPCAASVVGILAGCLLSFKMLERKGMFPGLPFPVFLGLTAGFLTWLLS